MENQNQKWVNISYLACGALLGFLVFVFAEKMAATYDLEARISSIDMIIRIGSILVGALLFVALYKNDKVNQFMNEVVVELSRVTWPPQQETLSGTVVVIIMVVASSLMLGFMDYISTILLKWIL